jgi:hypothetical protein
MKMKILYNPTDKDIIDYPISEAQVDAEGNILYDKDEKMLTTVRTLTWTIKAGEKVKVPAYVADYLMSVYAQTDPNATNRGLEVEEDTEEKTEIPVVKGDGVCKQCGKSFKSPRAMALHWAAKHPDLLK